MRVRKRSGLVEQGDYSTYTRRDGNGAREKEQAGSLTGDNFDCPDQPRSWVTV